MRISAVHRITYTHVHDRLTPSKFTITGHSGLYILQNPNCRATHQRVRHNSQPTAQAWSKNIVFGNKPSKVRLRSTVQ
jgi:hypothetical protein